MNTIVHEKDCAHQAISRLACRCERSHVTRNAAQHIVRLSKGLGDVKSLGDGVRELRIDVGPGWRVYFIEVEGQIIVLLVGGTKQSQRSDIDRARQMVKEMKKAAVAKAGTPSRPLK